MKSLSLALLITLIPMMASAGPSMAIWSGEPGSLSSELTTSADRPFDIVVTLDTQGRQALVAEFVMTELSVEFPGVFAIATTKINNTSLDLGYNAAGEYLMAFRECVQPGDQIELVRVTYADISGVIGSKSIVMKIRGFESGDSQLSSFRGLPGFVDCSENKYAAPMGGNSADGTLCVNCYLPPATDSSMSDLKSNF
jgi:hypothetical protein